MRGLGSCSLSAVHAHHVVQSGRLGFVPIETARRQQRALAGVRPQPFPASDKGCDARTHALRSRNGDDDAFGRGTHGTSEGAQVKAGLILLEKRKDHRSVAVRAERARSSVALPWKNEETERLSIGASLNWAGARYSQSPIDARTGR